MIPLFDRQAARTIDRDAIDSLGLPGLVLMENAGRGAAQAIMARFRPSTQRVVLLGGMGNNGGDAWVVARHWMSAGIRPVCILVGEEARLSSDARVNWEALRRLGADTRVVPPEGIEEIGGLLRDATLAVDGLFGTGLDRPLEGAYEAIVRGFDQCTGCKVALDVPSGIDTDTGAVLGFAPRVDLTLTFGVHKRGLFQFPAAQYVGELVLVDLGIPCPDASDTFLLDARDLGRWVTTRPRDCHKGMAGHVLVVGGAAGKTGAACLAGLGALRAGAGLVTVASPARAELAQHSAELMTADLAARGSELLTSLSTYSSVVFGPGLGRAYDGAILEAVVGAELPCVLDADALNLLATEGLELVKRAAGPRVLTPHPGEAARLLGCSTQAVQADRYAAARELALRSGQIVVLKGAGTIVQGASTRYVCSRGTPAMAVAGSGDVLSGVVATCLIDRDPSNAAALGVLLHALAGEAASAADRGLLASEIGHAIPSVVAKALERC